MDPFFQAQQRVDRVGGLPWGRSGGGYVEDIFATFGHGPSSKLEWERTAARKEAAFKRELQRMQSEMGKELAQLRHELHASRAETERQKRIVQQTGVLLSNHTRKHGDTSSGRARVPSVQDSDKAVVSKGRGGGSVPSNVAGDGAASRKGGVPDNGVRPEGEGVVPADTGDAEGRDAHDNEAGSPGAGGLREAEDGEGEVGS